MYTERRYKKRLHRNRPFILLGNEIDGQLFCEKFYEFENFTELREKLPTLLPKIRGEGEWSYELYQVPEDYRIWHRWGYYKYPSRGVKLFRYDYMSIPIKAVEFYNREISFVGAIVFNYNCSENEIGVEINRIAFEYLR